MISTFTAFIDANVFYGARLRSLVLYLAQTKLFRAKWSDEIHDEWIRNLLVNRPDLSEGNLSRTRQLMNEAIPDCLVTNHQEFSKCLSLPDPGDNHVLAAAVIGRANVIVTFNRDDFPDAILSPYGVHAKHPDNFLIDLFSLCPEEVIHAIAEDLQHYQNPSLSFDDYTASLVKAGVPQFSTLITQYKSWILATVKSLS